MIQKQRLYEEGGKTILRNTIDVQDALDMARDARETGGRGRNIIPLGFIPPEYWQFDPWLVEARKAQQAGDKKEFARLVQTFFKVHPAFSARTGGRRYWEGGMANGDGPHHSARPLEGGRHG